MRPLPGQVGRSWWRRNLVAFALGLVIPDIGEATSDLGASQDKKSISTAKQPFAAFFWSGRQIPVARTLHLVLPK
jgi:hypothetical protein